MLWGCFSGVDLGPLVLVKGNLNVSAYKGILDNYNHFSFQHDRAPVHKARSIKAWLCEFGVEELDWPGDCEPGPLIQHQYLTSQMLFWMNGQKFPQTPSKIL